MTGVSCAAYDPIPRLAAPGDGVARAEGGASVLLLSVTIHVLAALFWLGGMLFLGVVGAPVLRGVEPASLRAELFDRLGRRFRAAGWVAIGILVGTGVLNLHLRGLLQGDVLGDPQFWAGRFGSALAWKLGAVVVMLVLAAVHDFALGPRASQMAAGTPEGDRVRRRAAWVARVNALVGVVLVVAAVRLARG